MTKKILFACFALLAVAAYLVSAKPSKKSKNADDSAAKEALRTATKDFVRIEAGTFMMGTVGGGNFGNLPFDENEAHSVTLTRSYYMCDHEVTNAEYKAVMGKVHRLNKGGDNVPVVYVSWNNMIDYCNKLSELQGLTPCYTKEKGKVTCDFTANGYRLPTDAEWERAARAGNDTTELLTYNGITEDSSLDKETKDSLLGEYAWHPFNSGRKLHPVKEKKPNAWGLYDMTGNVWSGAGTGMLPIAASLRLTRQVLPSVLDTNQNVAVLAGIAGQVTVSLTGVVINLQNIILGSASASSAPQTTEWLQCSIDNSPSESCWLTGRASLCP